MRILSHMYHLGYGWGGGSVTMCLVLEALRRRGHEITLLLQRGEFDSAQTHGGCEFGIRDVFSDPPPRQKRDLYEAADIILTQGEATIEALALCANYDKPLVHMIHDEGQLARYKAHPSHVQLALYNAQWVMEAAERKGRYDNAMVLYPLIEPAHYRVDETGDALVLVNCCEEKGGQLFWELARLMPERRFLGVYGGWGWQIIPKPMLPNCEVMDHTLDPRDIYRQTRIVLMPSQDLGTPKTGNWTESFGRIGIEAAASGIPTIAHPTPGLVESLGAAGTFCDRYEPSQWIEAIRLLDAKAEYAEVSAAALKRSGELEPGPQLDALETALEQVRTDLAGRPAGPIDCGVDDLGLTAQVNGHLTVRALRRVAGSKPGDLLEVTGERAQDLLRRHLVELVEDDVAVETPASSDAKPVGAAAKKPRKGLLARVRRKKAKRDAARPVPR